MPPVTAPPLSATSVAMSPVPIPATLLRSVVSVGAVHCRSSACLSDHTDSTQLPAAAVAVGVVCEVPEPSAAVVTDAIGPEAAVPE